VIELIRLEFSRFYSTRFIRKRIFTQPEVTIVTPHFVLANVKSFSSDYGCNIYGPGSNKVFNVALRRQCLPSPSLTLLIQTITMKTNAAIDSLINLPK